VLLCGAAERLVRHHTGENLLITLHALNEELVDHPLKVGREGAQIVGLGSFNNLRILLRTGSNLIEEELIRLFEVGAETLIELLTDNGVGTVSFSEFISIGFAVDSVDQKLASLQQESIPIHSRPYETSAMKYFCIRDPDGLQVQFFQQK